MTCKYDGTKIKLFLAVTLLVCLMGSEAEDVNTVNMKLLTKFRETRSLAAPDIVIVLDESTSITPVAFQAAKKSCEMILQYYDKPDTRYSVIFFGSSSRIISPWSSNRVEVATMIREASQQGGTTEMGSALTKAQELYKQTEQTNSRTKRPRIVFMITDGYPSSDPSAVVLSLKWDSKATLFVVGVGHDIDLYTVEQLASPGYGFKVDSFEEFLKDLSIAQQTLLNGVNEGDSKIVFTAKLKENKLLGTKDNIPILLDIRNYLSKSIPANSAIVFRADKYLVPMRHFIRKEIPSMDQQTLEFELIPSAEASLQTLPEYISVNIVDNNGMDLPVEYDQIKLPLEYFVNDLVRMKSADKHVRALNALVFGVVGAGKSSWINSIVTALSHQVENQLASVGGTSGHVTTQLVRYRLYNIPDVPEVPLNLWDTWGVTPDNYDEAFISALLKGQVPNGFKIASTYSAGDNAVNITDYPLSREMHAVIIVVPQSITEDSGLLHKMQRAVEQMTEFNPLIVVTHMDEVSDEAYYPKVQTQIAREFRVPENRVNLVTNYVTDREKNFERDRANLVLLNDIMQSANARLKRHLATSDDFNNYVEQAEESEMSLVVAIVVALTAVAVVIVSPLYPFGAAPAPRNNPQPRPRRVSGSRPKRSSSRPESVQASPKNSSSEINAKKPAEQPEDTNDNNQQEEQPDPNDNNTPILDPSVNDNNSDTSSKISTPTPKPAKDVEEEEDQEEQEEKKDETTTPTATENDNDPNADNLQASLGVVEEDETPQAEEDFVLVAEDQN